MLSYDEFTDGIQGGESRLNPGKAVWYVLVEDGGHEIYYDEIVVLGEDDIDPAKIVEAYINYCSLFDVLTVE